MRSYELLYITEPRLEEEKLAAAGERINAYISKGEGSVEAVKEWGTRRLAYEIKNNQSGRYTLLTFKAPSESISKINRQVKLMPDVLRHIIVALED